MRTSTENHISQAREHQSTDVRQGEQEKCWFRSERFFTVDHQWYFTTREHVDVGPFSSREAAEHALSLFIDCVEKQETTVEHAVLVAKQGNWAVVGFH